MFGRPRQVTLPASARRMSRTIRIVVVLPAPFAPRKPKTWPGSTREADFVEGHDRSIALRHAVDHEGHGPRIAHKPSGPQYGGPSRPSTRGAASGATIRACRPPPTRPRSTPTGPPARSRSSGATATRRRIRPTTLRWLCPCAYCRGEAGLPGWLDSAPDPDAGPGPPGRHRPRRPVRRRADLGRRPPHRASTRSRRCARCAPARPVADRMPRPADARRQGHAGTLRRTGHATRAELEVPDDHRHDPVVSPASGSPRPRATSSAWSSAAAGWPATSPPGCARSPAARSTSTPACSRTPAARRSTGWSRTPR